MHGGLFFVLRHHYSIHNTYTSMHACENLVTIVWFVSSRIRKRLSFNQKRVIYLLTRLSCRFNSWETLIRQFYGKLSLKFWDSRGLIFQLFLTSLCCLPKEEFAESLELTQQAISKRLEAMGMIQKQGNWVSYRLKPRDVEQRFFACEQLFQR